MSRSAQRRALVLVGEQIERQRDDAARQSRHAQAVVADARATMKTLEDYSEELAGRRRAGGPHGATAFGLANATAFSVRLDEARDAQRQRVEDCEATARTLRATLVERQRRAKAIEWLIARRDQAALAQREKRDRIESEEWGMARHASLRLARPSGAGGGEVEHDDDIMQELQ